MMGAEPVEPGPVQSETKAAGAAGALTRGDGAAAAGPGRARRCVSPCSGSRCFMDASVP